MIHRSLNSFSLSFLSLVKNCNHKGLGIYYLLSAFIFGISGTLISVLIRIELYSSGNRIISPENQNFYNISITLHGFLLNYYLHFSFNNTAFKWFTKKIPKIIKKWENFTEEIFNHKLCSFFEREIICAPKNKSEEKVKHQ